MDKKIMIVGIGGVGGYLSALLANYYTDVTLIARNLRYEHIKNNGLTLHSEIYGEMNVKCNVVNKPEDAGIQDYIFICVKNYSLKEVLEDISPCVGENTIVIPVLNGVDHGEVCERMLDRGKVVDSLIYIVSGYNDDYSITQQGNYAYLYIGSLDDEINKKVSCLLNDAGIDCRISNDIEKELWNKYILNCAFNVLTAYYNCVNGEIKKYEKRCHEYKTLLEEAYQVGKRKGVDLDEDLVDRHYHRFMYNQPDNGTSSLKRDIENHRKNELETFCGYLVRLAQELNIEVPLTQYFYEELKKKN